jgi:PAS domain S-box-containing protein
MRVPGPAANEPERLAALSAYQVLDSPSEASFEDLAKLAAHILEAPMALVSLLDADRQWFKARYGLDVPETPRSISFCGHVVESGTSLVVPDALEDPRFADNPLVVGPPDIRFYAGAPLRTPDGFVLGTLCVLDTVKKAPTTAQLEMLGLLAARVVDQLEARKLRIAVAQERDNAKKAVERFSVLFESMNEGVVVVDADGVVTLTNATFERTLGRSGSALGGLSVFDPRWVMIHEDGRTMEVEQRPVVRCLRSLEPVRDEVVGIVQSSTRRTSWFAINAVPRIVAGRLVEVVATFHDVTASKLATDRSNQQDRLATVGTLAAGVGHEINNPLAYVIGNIEFALEELRLIAGPSPSARLAEMLEVLGEAREGADKIRKIVRGLRSLAREDVVLQQVDPGVVVETSLSMASHEIKHKASVVVELGDTPQVLADESRLTQVLVNLLVNAAQAFDSSGFAENRISVRSHTGDDGRVVIEVSDNGPGIPASLQKRIFDPFFTTKPVGQGTGLGLSVSRNIAATLGADLRVESEEGRGATFSIVLPPYKPISEPPEAPPAKGPRARILIVDDDVVVVNAMRRLLSREHDVVAFTDPRDALASLERGDLYDLVFCDLMMPYVTGQELYLSASALEPSLAGRFVFVTGGATDPAAASFLAEVSNERLDKPFATQSLLRIARRFAGSRG